MSAQDPAEIFRVEARELLESLEQNLLDLSERLDDRELVDAVFRGLHTLKGSGAMFGFDALAAFTHHCETAFDRVRKGEAHVTPELVSAVLVARDHMRALTEGRGEPAKGEALIARLHQVLEAAAGVPAQTVAAPAAGGWRIRFALPKSAFVNGVNPLGLLAELRELGPCEVAASTEAVPELDNLVPTECHLSWTVELSAPVPRSAIEDVFIFVMDDMTLALTQLEGPAAADIAAAAEHASEYVPDAAAPADGRKVRQNLRVDADRVDELMDRVGELVIVQSRLKQLALNSPDTALRSVSEEMERLASELRETMMAVRMVPVSNLFGRFRRLAHDLAHETGKSIEIVTRGEATELDKTIIERLADPLIHMIRNAADHGLESP